MVLGSRMGGCWCEVVVVLPRRGCARANQRRRSKIFLSFTVARSVHFQMNETAERTFFPGKNFYRYFAVLAMAITS